MHTLLSNQKYFLSLYKNFTHICMDIKIIEPVKKPIREFETAKEFETYYATYKVEMDGETTHILNKKYPIKGYRITRLKCKSCLKKDYRQETEQNTETFDPGETDTRAQERSQMSNDIIANLEKRVRYLEETLNKLIAHLENLRFYLLIKTHG